MAKGAVEKNVEAASETVAVPLNGAAAETRSLTPEALARLAEVRGRIQERFTQVVTAMAQTPRYRHQTLADLDHLVMTPLLNDCLAVASTVPAEGQAAEGGLAGIAIWAAVSDDVHEKVRDQVRAGSFPVRLGAADWRSGETVWLLDVIAPNRALATAVLRNFGQVAKDRPVHIHPIVARAVDPEVLKGLRAAEADTAGAAGEA